MRQFIPVNKPLSALRNIQHKTQPSLVLVIYSKFLFLYTPSRVMPQPHYVSTKLLPQCDGMLYFGFQSCMVEPGTLCVATNNFSFSSKFSGCAHTNFFLFFFLSFDTHTRDSLRQDKTGMRCCLAFGSGIRAWVWESLGMKSRSSHDSSFRPFLWNTAVRNKCTRTPNLEIYCKRAK